MNRKAVIFGLSGIKLSAEERFFLINEKPWGIILFKRNIKSSKQLNILINEIKKIFNDKKYPILIDQEGGRVCRLNNIIDFSFFSQKYFGNLYKYNKENFTYFYDIYIKNVANVLNKFGININTVPVLDVMRSQTNNVIGDRSYSRDHNIVSKIGFECIKLFSKYKIGTVMKHIPGHGLAKNDTHFKKTIVSSSKKILIKKDFIPFKNCNPFFAMTSHIIYKSYDSKYTATHSKIIIDKVIREKIGFKGLIISDDITMKSLNFGILKNATLALDAGCNLILHCNGRINEMKRLAKFVPKVDRFVSKKTSQFYQFLS